MRVQLHSIYELQSSQVRRVEVGMIITSLGSTEDLYKDDFMNGVFIESGSDFICISVLRRAVLTDIPA